MSASELPFDLAGCTVTAAEWRPRGLRLTLGDATAGGHDMTGARLAFEEVANRDHLYTFLTARLTYRRRTLKLPTGGQRTFSEYLYDSRPLKLPARLTTLRVSTAARQSYPDRVFATYYGAPPAAGPGRRVYLLGLSEPRFGGRGAFPIVCGRVALVMPGGVAHGRGETPAAKPLPAAVLTRLSKAFATAVLAGDRSAADELLTPECRKRFGRGGLAKLLPRGWVATVRHFGDPSSAVATIRREMTVEVESPPDAAIEPGFSIVPPHTIRGVTKVFPAPADSDVDPMCVLYFVGSGKEVRIAHAEPC
ncbi:MAG: hypothetical protein MUF18_11380 [Fimbriiglobus sp.]|jgi:hypothetical protein|nr:hypothetical protein [Fimbriiglobus sp.]